MREVPDLAGTKIDFSDNALRSPGGGIRPRLSGGSRLRSPFLALRDWFCDGCLRACGQNLQTPDVVVVQDCMSTAPSSWPFPESWAA